MTNSEIAPYYAGSIHWLLLDLGSKFVNYSYNMRRSTISLRLVATPWQRISLKDVNDEASL